MSSASTIIPADLSFLVLLSSSASLADAARQLGVTVAAVSKRLSQIEGRVGVALVVRTPRQLSLTREGELMLQYAHRILQDLDELQTLLGGEKQSLRGLIRVSASPGFGRLHVAPAIASFNERYPSLEIRLTLSEHAPGPSEDAFDVLVQFGEPTESRMIAYPIMADERVICAAPAYLAANGAPLCPADLVHHNCIDLRQGSSAYGVWRFTRPGAPEAREEQVRIRGSLSTNDGSVAVEWAVRGRGLLMRSMWNVSTYLNNGSLVRVLDGWRTPDASIYAVYPEQHRTSRRIKLFVEHLRACALGLAAPTKQ